MEEKSLFAAKASFPMENCLMLVEGSRRTFLFAIIQEVGGENFRHFYFFFSSMKKPILSVKGRKVMTFTTNLIYIKIII